MFEEKAEKEIKGEKRKCEDDTVGNGKSIEMEDSKKTCEPRRISERELSQNLPIFGVEKTWKILGNARFVDSKKCLHGWS